MDGWLAQEVQETVTNQNAVGRFRHQRQCCGLAGFGSGGFHAMGSVSGLDEMLEAGNCLESSGIGAEGLRDPNDGLECTYLVVGFVFVAVTFGYSSQHVTLHVDRDAAAEPHLNRDILNINSWLGISLEAILQFALFSVSRNGLPY